MAKNKARYDIVIMSDLLRITGPFRYKATTYNISGNDLFLKDHDTGKPVLIRLDPTAMVVATALSDNEA